jgi:Zn-dependent protease with chaperone function
MSTAPIDARTSSPTTNQRPPGGSSDNRIVLNGLPSNSFRHPLDVAATVALGKTKGIDAVAKFFSSNYVERIINIANISEYTRVGPSQYAEIYDRYTRLATILSVPQIPDLFIMNSPEVNAYAMGIERYTIRVTSALVDIMTDEELDAILAHELGHVKCDHMKYMTMAWMLQELGGFAAAFIPIPGVGEAFLLGVQLSLMEWYRKAEFSCDRAALLAVQDIEPVQRALGKLAGFSHEKKLPINIDALVSQANDYDDIGASSILEKALKLYVLMDQTHPYPVIRVREIGEWATSSEFKSILEKHNVVRSETRHSAIELGDSSPMTLQDLAECL